MYFIPNSRLDEIYCDYPKEKITKLKHGELTENEVYQWIMKNK